MKHTIGLEATRANKQYKTGTEWYAWHLLQEFKKLNKDNKFVVYYKDYLAGDLKDAPDNFIFKKLAWSFKKFWTHIRLSCELIKNPVDKFFASNAVPLCSKGEIIVTIHDLGFYRNPKLYHPLELIYQKISHHLAIKKADKIIAVSEATKKDIIRFFPSAEDKIRVIYHGWNYQDFGVYGPEDIKAYKDRHDLPDKFILYIGRLETKKNIQNLIKSYKKTTRRWPLVLGGRPGNHGYKEIEELIKDPEINHDIILLGYVSQNNYPKLMAAASAFVFPSKFEGFGIPLLEAMASSVPVACSDIEVLHEVAGEAALYFDPDDTVDMSAILDKLMKDKDLCRELVAKGQERAKEFSWQKAAQETLDYILE
ncbi:hypothetical protein C0580_02835 [Candidatus Parcubacteria bacterium]|nr:MAG: hypothetical protein C0580_02835 [Candidatus Parcubacteria bacterium]